MTESFGGSSDSHYEYGKTPLPPSETIGLHSQTMEVPTRVVPVIPKEAALLQYGIPGDVLLIMRFPFDEQAQLAKEVAVVDYGEDVREDHAVPYTVVRRDLDKELVMVGDRYGLRPLNYEPYDPAAGHVPLRPGVEVMIGSGMLSAAGRRLGMWGAPDVGNARIAPKHTTIELADDWFTLRDHSGDGTEVTVSTASPG